MRNFFTSQGLRRGLLGLPTHRATTHRLCLGLKRAKKGLGRLRREWRREGKSGRPEDQRCGKSGIRPLFID